MNQLDLTNLSHAHMVLDTLINALSYEPTSREKQQAVIRLQEARLWLIEAQPRPPVWLTDEETVSLRLRTNRRPAQGLAGGDGGEEPGGIGGIVLIHANEVVNRSPKAAREAPKDRHAGLLNKVTFHARDKPLGHTTTP